MCSMPVDTQVWSHVYSLISCSLLCLTTQLLVVKLAIFELCMLIVVNQLLSRYCNVHYRYHDYS